MVLKENCSGMYVILHRQITTRTWRNPQTYQFVSPCKMLPDLLRIALIVSCLSLFKI